MQKNETLTLRVDSLGHNAEGVARHEGQVVFVPGALPGETVRALVVKAQKAHAFAKLIEVLVPSPDREAPPCPWYPRCGGCSCQHMRYEAELEMKRRLIENVFLRIGGMQVDVPPVLGMDSPWHYRNKTSQPVVMQDGRPRAGFYGQRSHRVIAADSCLVARPESDEAAHAITDWMQACGVPPYDEESHSGLVRHVMTRVNRAGECMVTLIINGESLPHQNELILMLRERVTGLVSLCVSPNTRRGNTILGSGYRTLYGAPRLKDRLCGYEFLLSPLSFFQINPLQAERLYQKALDLSGVRPDDLVFDLYCGAGTISSLFAARCRQVIGIEIVPQAVEDAVCNAKMNGIANARFLAGAAEELMPQLVRDGQRPRVIVLDPPRKGAAPEVLRAIAQAVPERIVYISCDPATQARDARALCESGFRITAMQSVDMFCRTPDIENICLFER